MKISELSHVSGVSVASIKYYLRERLLPAGAATGANQADYSDEHVRRLRLIRALIDIGGLPVAGVREVLGAVDDDTTSMHDTFGAVMHGLGEPPPDPTKTTDELSGAVAEVRSWLRRRRWKIEPDAPAPFALAELLVTLRRFDFVVTTADLDGAADAAEQTAQFEVGYAFAKPDRTSAVETMLVGTVVYERIFAEIRRLALEATSAKVRGSTHRKR